MGPKPVDAVGEGVRTNLRGEGKHFADSVLGTIPIIWTNSYLIRNPSNQGVRRTFTLLTNDASTAFTHLFD